MPLKPRNIHINVDRLKCAMGSPPSHNAFKNDHVVIIPQKPISENKLLELSGVSIRTQTRVRKSGMISPETLKDICAALDISPDYLTGNNDIVMTSFNSFQQSAEKSRRLPMSEYPMDSSSFNQFKKYYKSLNRIDKNNILIQEYAPPQLSKDAIYCSPLQFAFNQFLRLAGYAQYDFIPDGWDKSYYLQQTLDLISNLNNKMNEADISAALAADREAPPDRKPSEPEKPIPVKPSK